ncbi:CHAT domain-containing protein [Suillus bovinus]|uniref:CHAT domain-containing protein n=1 Tax=Suillus bovinus TaxID=48563 RepID=UPI001B85E820|nr:CHAT domain-containing protein [Suillus bovinus]KAG2151608.1 CHAT domain-containing protein [Suillus bovinus]
MDALALKTDAGHGLLARYRRTQNSGDLEQSTNHFERALDLCPMDHPYRPAALFNLATAKFISCQANRAYLDLDIPISLFQDALDLRATGHPDRPVTQLHLAISLLLHARFQRRGNDKDLDQGIALLQEVLPLFPVGHEERYVALDNLAGQLSTRFGNRGNDEDLDRAIGLYNEALALCPIGQTDRSMLLSNLATELTTLFCYRGNDEDLDQAIALESEVLASRPVGHPDRPLSLHNLAISLSTRFDHRGNNEDLDQAIALEKAALTLHPVGHKNRSYVLNGLAGHLSTRFKHRGNDEDLNQAIALQREALDLRPVGHTDRYISLSDLATRLFTRFRHRGDHEDLDQGITFDTEALALCPVGHPSRSASLHNLATQFSTRFERRGNDEDLNRAIALHREALALCPVGHTGRSVTLNSLANTLSTRFRHRGDDEDLDRAIGLLREGLTLRPVGHTDRSNSLISLANRLSDRFDHRGNDEDLDQAITLLREALALLPVSHTNRSEALICLANALSTRFKHRGNNEDLDQAIALQTEALDLHPVGHIVRSKSLNNLAGQLSARFDLRGNDEDLDQAISLYHEALALHPIGHKDRSVSLSNLASQLSIRSKHQGNDADLDQAITLHREALALRPVGHTDRPTSLHNLANTLSIRFEHQHSREDFDESRNSLVCALSLLTQHDPRQTLVHNLLAHVYLLFHRSRLDGTSVGENVDSLDTAMNHLKAAANVASGHLPFRLRGSLGWASVASQYSHTTELEAYATSMQLLDSYMSTTASVSSRHNVMKDFPSTLAVDAASRALRSGEVRRAVELLEQGRTIIWTQMTRLRMPLDSLETCGDHAVTLMKRFRGLSSLLDKPPAMLLEGTPRVDAEAEENRYRRLVEDWNRVVEEIRKIEGFSRFLLPPLFSDLQDAARDGPIILLVASKWSCHAIIIPHKQPPISIQLSTSVEKLQILVDKLHRTDSPALKKALTELWDDVVRPVVENLDGIAPRGSRIWWCLTSVFNFLPLHAAGEYRKNGQFLSQLYISSYTPSLTALIKARRSHERSPSVPFVAIGQNRPAGASFTLDAVEPELELVRKLLPPSPTVSFSKITSVDATKSRALCALRDNTWLHLACHGTQNIAEPFKSAFLMRDEPLSLLDITQTDLSQHQFAFLSACETAVGDHYTPDEVIHLAAGLQFAGVKSVIGTLWKVNDSTVHRLVEAFYKNLCGNGTMNSKRAARALHQAVLSLARDKDNPLPLDQRILFVHIGI